jgi:predicted nuclease of predicted toxin-antitoxin system
MSYEGIITIEPGKRGGQPCIRGMHDASDTTVWLHARQHDFTVVSKDADFSEISMELGYPPKLLWLRIKNWSTDQIEDLIRSKYPLIVELPAATERGILVLFKKSVG